MVEVLTVEHGTFQHKEADAWQMTDNLALIVGHKADPAQPVAIYAPGRWLAATVVDTTATSGKDSDDE